MSPPIAKRMGDYQKEQKRIQAEVQAAGGEAGGAAAVPAGSVDIIQAEVAVSIEAGTTAVTGAETQSGEQQQHQHAEGTHEAETLVQVLVHEQVDGDPAAGSEPMSR
jgi:ABC-type phosphate transport system substrate-binding protein